MGAIAVNKPSAFHAAGRLRTGAILLMLALLALAAHGRSVTYPFLDYDDPFFVLEVAKAHGGLSWASLRYAFLDVGADTNWVPLARLSHLLDIQLYGLDARGHHVTNVLLHVANAMLLWLTLHCMTGAAWRPAVVAALLAVHPVHVESVAWVSERRDVLSLFFGLLAMLAYTGYVRRPSLARHALTSLCIALAIMAKPTMVTLPCVLMLLDGWPLGRWRAVWGQPSRWRGLLWMGLEKLPWLGLSAVGATLTSLAQTRAYVSMEMLPWALRLVRVPLAHVDYLLILVWPVNLSPLYPHHHLWTVGQAVVGVVWLVGMGYVALRCWRPRPYLLTGWLWFVGAMVPMIGLVQVGLQTHACRYAYFPFIGLYILLAWLSGDMLAARALPRFARRAAWVVMAVIVVCLAGLSWRQTAIWSSDEALYQAMARNTGSVNPMSVTEVDRLMAQGRLDEARRILRLAAGYRLLLSASLVDRWAYLERRAGQPEVAQALATLLVRGQLATDVTWSHLGDLAMEHGQFDKAIEHYQKAIEKAPHQAIHVMSLGLAHESKGDHAQADAHLLEALAMRPDHAEILWRAGLAWHNRGQHDRAIEPLATAAARLKGAEALQSARYTLAVSLSRMGRLEESAQAYRQALEVRPDWSAAWNGLGVTLARRGLLAEARDAFAAAVEHDPANTQAQDNLRRAEQALRDSAGTRQGKPAPAQSLEQEASDVP